MTLKNTANLNLLLNHSRVINFINKLDGSGLTYMAVLKPVIIMIIFDVVVYGLVLLLALGIIIYEWYDERKSKKL